MTIKEFLNNNFAEIIGLIFIWMIIHEKNMLTKKDMHDFMCIFYCELAELLAYNLELITRYFTHPSPFRIILSAIAYVLRAVLVYMFIRLIWPYENNKKAITILSIPIVICVICGFSPFFTNVVYYFDSNNIFHRGPLGYVFIVAVIVYILLFLYYIAKQNKEESRINTPILWLIAIFIIISTIMSTIYEMEDIGRLSIVYGTVFCLFALDANKLQKTIYALKENKELKIALNDLEEMKKKADVANEAKTTFLLNMSHDIRTPLNGIIGLLDIGDRFSDDLAKQNELRKKVKDASMILLELVNDVLDRSKLESGEVILEHVPFDVGNIAGVVNESLVKQAEEMGVEIINEFNIEHTSLVGSPVHLKRVLMNIISNAIKYNKKDGKIFVSYDELDYDGDKLSVRFTCKDTGIGMSKEFMEHIFEPFSQEKIDARSSYTGTGLGMSIVKSIVDKMNGSIIVKSQKDVGSTFIVTIPFEVNKILPDINSDKDEEDYSIKGLNILLVEDNELNMEIAQFLLEEEGAIITKAVNGKQAIEIYKEDRNFDVILMDVMMPVKNGYEATMEIRQFDKDVPIIAMTANAFVEDKAKAKECGMNAHISKPLDSKVLIKTIALTVNENK